MVGEGTDHEPSRMDEDLEEFAWGLIDPELEPWQALTSSRWAVTMRRVTLVPRSGDFLVLAPRKTHPTTGPSLTRALGYFGWTKRGSTG